MRRSEKEITDQSVIEEIIHGALVCRLALSESDQPHIVPLCFGYQDYTLYFHSASEGKKVDIIKKNPNVCFEFDINTEIVKAEKACQWGMRYKSIIGFGRAVIVENIKEKEKAISIIMNQYSNEQFQFDEDAIRETTVIKVDIDSMSGKESG
ncbi:MAG: pyridoxamine 5'-phosphate oxidase family protein [Proteobacteria bacterium]|nr:pyridoxamine 5'-phosphate oxidase family protein [Pseudomonadota bacterium]